MTVIDSFPYAGEKKVLDIRLNELDSVVSYFLIVESNRTQTGLEKPYFFEQEKENFKKFENKIYYVKLDDKNINNIPEADWSHEFNLRRAIKKYGLKVILEDHELFNNDILIVSDVDEIPRKESILNFIAEEKDILCLNHYFNSYYLNLYSTFRNWGWYGSILMRLEVVNQNDIQYLRNIKDFLPHTGNEGEGWHFSNLLTNGFESLYNKWKNNIEPHDKSCLKNKDLLEKQFNKCLHEDMNFFFCDNPLKREILLDKLPLDKIPIYCQNNFEKFKSLILK